MALYGLFRLLEVLAESMRNTGSPVDPPHDDHRPRLPADLVLTDYLLMEVVYHDLGLSPDGLVVTLDVAVAVSSCAFFMSNSGSPSMVLTRL